jgi:hypothetical protein
MAKHAIEVLSDPGLYKALSEAGQKRAGELFSVAKILPQYVSFYEKAISESN